METAGLGDGLQTGHIWCGHTFPMCPQPVVPAGVRGNMVVAISTMSSCSWRSKALQSSMTHRRQLEEMSGGKRCSPLPMPILAALTSADSLLQQPRGKILFPLSIKQKQSFALVAAVGASSAAPRSMLVPAGLKPLCRWVGEGCCPPGLVQLWPLNPK